MTKQIELIKNTFAQQQDFASWDEMLDESNGSIYDGMVDGVLEVALKKNTEDITPNKVLVDALKEIEGGAEPCTEREFTIWVATAKRIASAALASYADSQSEFAFLKEAIAEIPESVKKEVKEMMDQLDADAAPQEKSKGPWHIRKEESTPHPESGEWAKEITDIITDGENELLTDEAEDNERLQRIVDALNASECRFRVDDAARLNAFCLSHEAESLRQWKTEAMEVYAPLHKYAQGHPDAKLGTSMVSFVIERARMYDEIIGGQVTGKSAGELANKWVYETNGHKWSNNNDEAGDNYGSFIAGFEAGKRNKEPIVPSNSDDLMDAEEFFNTYMRVDKVYLLPAWASSLAERYSDYVQRQSGEAGKLPEQQPADGARIQELSLMVYTLSKVLAKKTCTESEQKMIDGADQYLRKHFNPSDVLRAHSDVSGEQPADTMSKERFNAKIDHVSRVYERTKDGVCSQDLKAALEGLQELRNICCEALQQNEGGNP